jgi:hypothetical protein
MEQHPAEQSNRQDFQPTTEFDPAKLLARWRHEKGTYFPTTTIKKLSPVIVISFILLILSLTRPDPSYWLLGLIGLGVSAGIIYYAGQGLTEAQRHILARVSGLQDPQAIGPLLEMLEAEEPLHRAVIAALTRLLTHTNPQDAVALIGSRHDRLYQLLDYTMTIDHPELGAAILRLLPLLADRRALVWAARYIWWSTPGEQRSREAAHAALPLLLERVDLGGLPTLTDWIRRLPLNLKDPPMWEAILLPHLALMQILPQCTPEQFLMVSSRDRQRLYTNLRTFMMPRLKSDYAVVVLDMVRRAADVEALSTVRDLIDGLHSTPYPRIRKAARECLPILKDEVERQKVSKTLLRGASAPQAAPDTLLRAASGAVDIDPQLLLRANVLQSVGDARIHEPVSSVHRPEYGVQKMQAGEIEQDATVRLSGGRQ